MGPEFPNRERTQRTPARVRAQRFRPRNRKGPSRTARKAGLSGKDCGYNNKKPPSGHADGGELYQLSRLRCDGSNLPDVRLVCAKDYPSLHSALSTLRLHAPNSQPPTTLLPAHHFHLVRRLRLYAPSPCNPGSALFCSVAPAPGLDSTWATNYKNRKSRGNKRIGTLGACSGKDDLWRG
jgi:hypothetical protein